MQNLIDVFSKGTFSPTICYTCTVVVIANINVYKGSLYIFPETHFLKVLAKFQA